MTKLKNEVMQDLKTSELKIEELESILQEVNQKNNELSCKLMVEQQNANGFQNEYDEIVRLLKAHNYKGCQCQLKFIPVVEKAINQPTK